MRKQFLPRPYQHKIIEHIVDTPRCAVWAGMGLGKTVATLTAIDIINLVEPGPTLVLAPLRVASSTWPDEAAKWTHLKNLKISAIVGDVVSRRKAMAVKADVYTINYENLPWLVEQCGDAWPYGKIVADESTKLKGFRLRQGTLRARALAQVAHSKVTRFIQLTGTPSPNGLQDLWGQFWFLDRGSRLGRSFGAFESRWFQKIQVGGDPHAVQIKPLAFAQTQIEDAVRDLCISLDAKDHFKIDEPIVNSIKVEMSAKALAQYKEMEKEMFIELENGAQIEALNAASKTIKCLQIANGAIYTDDTRTTFTEIHNEKIKALESIVEEAAGMPILVAYHFKHDLARLQKAFAKGRALDSDPDTIRAWNAGKIPLLFAHPASAGHGLNLQDGGNILAFFGHWWNLEEYQQIIERIGPARQAQSGYDRPVFIHHIVTKDTMDDVVMLRRDSKREVQDLLLEAMKQRKEE